MKIDKVKIALITDEMSPLVSAVADSEFDVAGIATFDGSGKNGTSRIKTTLKAILRSKNVSFEDFCQQRKLEFCILGRKEIDKLVQFISSVKPDVIILFCVPLLPAKLFDIANICTINLHPSMLPMYRGADPSTHMILDNVRIGGVTIHKVDSGEDTGDILNQEKIDIPKGMKRMEYVNHAIFDVGIPLLMKTLHQLATDTADPIKQPTQSSVDRARKLTNEEILIRIKWNEWPIERVWFALCFLQERVGLLPLANSWRKWFKPEVRKAFVENKNFDLDHAGQFVQHGRSGYYVHPKGKIYVDYPFSIKQIIKHLISSVLSLLRF